jgi:hypothetical protein
MRAETDHPKKGHPVLTLYVWGNADQIWVNGRSARTVSSECSSEGLPRLEWSGEIHDTLALLTKDTVLNRPDREKFI